jgi:imidazoleglycerol-phosphate dehydratase / histidinol-phosphatase
MKKVLFIDRDGTILAEPPDEQVDSFEKMEFMPGVISALAQIASETDYELIMITNQDGLGSESFPGNTFWPVQEKMVQILKGEGVVFKEIFIDHTFPEENAPTRKPGTAMLTKYLSGGIDLTSSYVIGDKLTDIELAKNIGCKAILISENNSPDAEVCTKEWNIIYRFLKNRPRSAKVERKTAETSIKVKLDLNGTGKSSVSTGIGFFDHLLDQIARHGNIDLLISANGDLKTDEHHTIEDIAITLGEAFNIALGSKRGIERYGFVLPMDDCLAAVAIDFSGRPWIVWDAEFNREKIGEMPTEMFFHFFKSLADNAKCNLNIKAEGTNEHHKIEAIFKAFGKTIKMAVKQTDNNNLPTTKGSL